MLEQNLLICDKFVDLLEMCFNFSLFNSLVDVETSAVDSNSFASLVLALNFIKLLDHRIVRLKQENIELFGLRQILKLGAFTQE
jgi:hypothetical protein